VFLANEVGAADKAADLARWKSLRRQLPVFGRLDVEAQEVVPIQAALN
jgi:hypothetical protein